MSFRPSQYVGGCYQRNHIKTCVILMSFLEDSSKNAVLWGELIRHWGFLKWCIAVTRKCRFLLLSYFFVIFFRFPSPPDVKSCILPEAAALPMVVANCCSGFIMLSYDKPLYEVPYVFHNLCFSLPGNWQEWTTAQLCPTPSTPSESWGCFQLVVLALLQILMLWISLMYCLPLQLYGFTAAPS